MKNSTLYLLLGLILGFWAGYVFYDYNILHEEIHGAPTTTLTGLRQHVSEIILFILTVAAPFGIKLYKERTHDELE